MATTYYSRPQLKPAPFNKVLVGGYVFLAGLVGRGATAVDAAGSDARGSGGGSGAARAAAGDAGADDRQRAAGGDLHTPQRFYNMLRVFKTTSPMSIGTWILMAFSGFSGITAAAGLLADRFRWLRRAARVAQVPAAAAGAGLGHLHRVAVFGDEHAALGSRASGFGGPLRGFVDCFGRGGIEPLRRPAGRAAGPGCGLHRGAGGGAGGNAGGRCGIPSGQGSIGHFKVSDGQLETIGGTDFGTIVPLGLLAVSLLTGSRSRGCQRPRPVRCWAGSLMMRIGMIGSGQVSAKRPDISLRFTQGR